MLVLSDQSQVLTKRDVLRFRLQLRSFSLQLECLLALLFQRDFCVLDGELLGELLQRLLFFAQVQTCLTAGGGD